MTQDSFVPEEVLWSCLEALPTQAEIQTATMLSLVLGAGHGYAARSMLWAIVRALRPAYIVETGTNHGLTSAYMWKLSKQLGAPTPRVVTFDIGASTLAPALWERIHAAKDITFVHGDSASMIPRVCTAGVQLALIDGDHSYKGAEGDWHAIEPLLADRSVVFFDNMQHSGGCGAFAATLRPLWFHPELAIKVQGLSGREVREILATYVQRNLALWVTASFGRCGNEARTSLQELLKLLEGPLENEPQQQQAVWLCRSLSDLASRVDESPLSEKMALSVRHGIGTPDEVRRQRVREALPSWFFKALSKSYHFVKGN